MHALFTLPLRFKRDCLIVRQRARQIAALLHFSPDEQACIAAGAFAVAAEALREPAARELCIQLENRTLHVFARVTTHPEVATGDKKRTISFFSAQRSLRLVKPLPADAANLAGDDLAWIAAQLETHFHTLFDEVRNQNQEVLALLHELRTCRAELEALRMNPIAA